ncbi:FAD/NAD(P)-binding domain-containing protein [Exidia glandulosa HHB12029]|uniref:FAD/NAD(P)-binding domain-containing protein n=1 Tax=Exidia glandulosa HHB12029 TaxID=1314781 RepID=A0A165FYV8_EXIGL|nr:FAD/NAD(P)-binding domain-containing protein [Exidia glandulosa HHB12029]
MLHKLVYDVAIIGGGPAGLAAALAVSRAHRRAVLFDSGKYRNERAEHAHTIVGFDGKPPAEIRATAWKEISAYGYVEKVERCIETVKSVSSSGNTLFEIDGEWNARKIVLASGVQDVLPDIPGFADAWGYKIYHCAFCHGHEVSGLRGAIFGVGSLMPAKMFLNVTTDIAVLLNGESLPTEGPVNDSLVRSIAAMSTAAEPRVISHAVSHVEMGPTHDRDAPLKVHFAGSEQPPIELDFLAYAPRGRARTFGLDVEMAPENGDVKLTSPFGTTNVPGVYAAGDMAVMAKAVPTALATGMMAGAGAVHDLTTEDLKDALEAVIEM